MHVLQHADFTFCTLDSSEEEITYNSSNTMNSESEENLYSESEQNLYFPTRLRLLRLDRLHLFRLPFPRTWIRILLTARSKNGRDGRRGEDIPLSDLGDLSVEIHDTRRQ